MKAFQRIASFLSYIGVLVSVIIVVMMVAHILYEIVLRTFFASSTFVLDEMVGYGVAGMAYMALGSTLEHGGLIRVNLLLTNPRPDGALRRWVEVACSVLTMGAVGIAAWFFGRSVIYNIRDGFTSGTIADTPIWIPEAFVFCGMVVFLVQLLAYLLRVLSGEQDLGNASSVNISGVE